MIRSGIVCRLLSIWASFHVLHCVKSVHIWSLTSPYFSTSGLNTNKYGVSPVISPNTGKYGPEKGDSAPIMNILEFLVRSIHSLMLTRIVIKMVIVGSQMDTLVVRVRYLGKFAGTNFSCWSCKRKVSIKFCRVFFVNHSKSIAKKWKTSRKQSFPLLPLTLVNSFQAKFYFSIPPENSLIFSWGKGKVTWNELVSQFTKVQSSCPKALGRKSTKMQL